jgi:hypothetical protein
LTILALALVACGGSSSSASTGEDAGDASTHPLPDGGASDAPLADSAQPGPDSWTCSVNENDSSTCNDINPGGGLISSTCSTDTPPQPQGGTIEDGVYVLTGETYYGMCPATPIVETNTWIICGNRWDASQRTVGAADGGFTTVAGNYVASLQGTTATLTSTCAASTSTTMRGFTAAGGHLTFFLTSAGQTILAEHVKQ